MTRDRLKTRAPDHVPGTSLMYLQGLIINQFLLLALFFKTHGEMSKLQEKSIKYSQYYFTSLGKGPIYLLFYNIAINKLPTPNQLRF